MSYKKPQISTCHNSRKSFVACFQEVDEETEFVRMIADMCKRLEDKLSKEEHGELSKKYDILARKYRYLAEEADAACQYHKEKM